MIRLERESLIFPAQEPDFVNNIAIFNRVIERTLDQIETRLENIEFEDFDIVLILSGTIELQPPPFRNIQYSIAPEATPIEITEQIHNILSTEFGVFEVDD